MIWASIKAKCYIAITLLVAALFAALKIQSARLKKSQKIAEELGARVEHATNVIQAKEENKAEFVSRSRDIAKDIEDRGTSKELEDPNKW